jgi:hypothetical protein
MPVSDAYRKIAEPYYALAREAKNETERITLLDLAHTWLEVASRKDQMTITEMADAQKLAREVERVLRRERTD